MLSPMDIRDKSFNVKMRGFDQDQVNDFLDQIIADYEAAIKKNDDLEAKLKEAQAKVDHYDGLKDAMNQSIIVAQSAADTVKKQAETEAQNVQDEAEANAEKLLSDASAKSNQILSDASDKARQLSIQTEDMRRTAKQFRDHLALLLKAELETVQSAQWDDALDAPIATVDTDAITKPEGDAADSAANADAADTAAAADTDSTSSAAETQSDLDSEGSDSLDSKADGTASADADPAQQEPEGEYTEIVFPDDDPKA
ncbi:DivIVA domain-containing protein [Lacticaseibacillus zhaodongensis]|uniref:DivIVA domain-containing protein n=1 Tax=Lacticaseibacillus zhaodongensis TaxID=2668065 RepID=UPI0012D305AC|nr:DivIVA domain-containing protein [Lacticaseibacillus zhaodongensis]